MLAALYMRASSPHFLSCCQVLRDVARLLGLHEAAARPKRAIQFGSRVARAANRRDFGSNRAANNAAAGSAPMRLGGTGALDRPAAQE